MSASRTYKYTHLQQILEMVAFFSLECVVGASTVTRTFKKKLNKIFYLKWLFSFHLKCSTIKDGLHGYVCTCFHRKRGVYVFAADAMCEIDVNVLRCAHLFFTLSRFSSPARPFVRTYLLFFSHAPLCQPPTRIPQLKVD